MNQAFAHELSLKIWKINIRAQKIDGTTLKINGMVVFTFSMLNKDSREKFLKKTFYWLISS